MDGEMELSFSFIRLLLFKSNDHMRLLPTYISIYLLGSTYEKECVSTAANLEVLRHTSARTFQSPSNGKKTTYKSRLGNAFVQWRLLIRRQCSDSPPG